MPEAVTGQLYRRHMAAETSLQDELVGGDALGGDALGGDAPAIDWHSGADADRCLVPPPHLSPSSMGTFTSCPLAFRFSYLERLPEAPSAPACKGTLVHLALQHLCWRPPAERTMEAALADLARARAELEASDEFARLELTPEDLSTFHAEAEELVRRYFEMEDPRTVRVVGVELRLAAVTDDGVTIRGII